MVNDGRNSHDHAGGGGSGSKSMAARSQLSDKAFVKYEEKKGGGVGSSYGAGGFAGGGVPQSFGGGSGSPQNSQRATKKRPKDAPSSIPVKDGRKSKDDKDRDPQKDGK